MADIVSKVVPGLSATSDMPAAPAVPSPPPVVTPAVANSGDETQAATPVATPIAPQGDLQPIAKPAPSGTERFNGRITDLVRERRELQDTATEFRNIVSQQGEQIKQLLDVLVKNNPPPTVPVDTSEPRPMRDAFTEESLYDEALVDWAGRRAANEAATSMRKLQEENDRIKAENEQRAAEERERNEQRERDRRQVDELNSNWETRAQAAREKYSDFDALTQGERVRIPVGSPMAYAILTRDDGAEIAYYLGQHPEESARIAQMIVPGQTYPMGSPLAGLPMWDGVAQIYELGQIAAKLKAAAVVPTPPPATNVLSESPSGIPLSSTSPDALPRAEAPSVVVMSPPTPPTPLTGTAEAANTRGLTEMNMEEYAADWHRRNPRGGGRVGRGLN